MIWMLKDNFRIFKENLLNELFTYIPNKILFLIFTRISAITIWYHPNREFGTITIQEITEALTNDN